MPGSWRSPRAGLTPARAGTAGTCRREPSAARAHPRAGGDGSSSPQRRPGGTGSPARGRGRQIKQGDRTHAHGLTPARAGTACTSRPTSYCRRAHPRAGGDGVARPSMWEVATGSPPRGRGRQEPHPQRPVLRGLTPARAGTALRRRGSRGWSRAHPRAGGDGRTAIPSGTPMPGSPPRGRGRRRSVERTPDVHGLTPAPAGTALRATPDQQRPKAHPRAGGDGSAAGQVVTFPSGSPPRGRGRRRLQDGRRRRPGLTPARAGTAPAAARRGAPGGAHPRAGGDGLIGAPSRTHAVGSPPRGRGRPYRCISSGTRNGLTPARAGTAYKQRIEAARARAHPRAGGDGTATGFARTRSLGSPPRGRGRLPPNPSEHPGEGLTPARAGTAETDARCAPPGRAHPRAGGDGPPVPNWSLCAGGSPPRGRGRPAGRPPRAPDAGLTPARAGTA